MNFLLVFLFLLQQRYSRDTPVFAIFFGRLLLDICDDGELWAARVCTHVLISVSALSMTLGSAVSVDSASAGLFHVRYYLPILFLVTYGSKR